MSMITSRAVEAHDARGKVQPDQEIGVPDRTAKEAI